MSEHLAKNTAFMTMASVGQKLIAFVYFLFLARIMMPERTGVFFLATSIITMFSVVTDLGLTSVVIREIAKNPNEIRRIVKESIGLKCLLIICAVLVVSIASLFFGYDALTTELIRMTMIVMIFDALALLCYGILRGSQQLKYEAIGIVTGQFVTVGIGLCSLFFFPNVQWLVVALICGSATSFLVAFTRVVHIYSIKIFIPEWSAKNVISLMKIMAPFALAGIFTKIYSSLDVVLISKLMDASAVGIYSIAYKFTYAFQFLPLAFSAALYPSLSSSIDKDPSKTSNLFLRAIWYILLIATPIVFGIWLVAPEMITLLGHDYRESVPILRTLIFVLFPSFLEIPFGALLNASNRQYSRMKILGITMSVNACLDLILIPNIGLMGAIIGSLVSYTFMIFMEIYTVKKFLPGVLNHRLIQTSFGIVISGLFMLGIGILLGKIFPLLFTVPCSMIVYICSLWLTKSLKLDDLVVFKSLFRKSSPIL